MPELPEVEIMCQRLARRVLGARVRSVHIDQTLDRYVPAASLLSGTICDVHRIGKVIRITTLTKGSKEHVYCHHAMTGYWDTDDDPWTFDYVEGRRRAVSTDVRVELVLSSPVGHVFTLRFHDARKFGRFSFSRPTIGPEVLVTSSSAPDVVHASSVGDLPILARRGKDRTIKEVLMDQRIVAGVGNIYAAEALYTSRIRPQSMISNLSDEVLLAIQGNAALVMATAISRALSYDSLQVYRRQKCPAGHRVERVDLAGRSSYYCPTCQP